MNCKEFHKQLEGCFGRTIGEIDFELQKHSESCSECKAYLNDLSLLRDALTESPSQIYPGELDDIVFERIASIASGKGQDRRPAANARYLKWMLATVTAAAATILIIFLAWPRNNSDNPYTGIGLYSSYDIENAIVSSDTLGAEFVSALAGDDAEFENASDELLNGLDVNEMLSGMSADELKSIYDKINNLKG